MLSYFDFSILMPIAKCCCC